jgi:hypothetical protein
MIRSIDITAVPRAKNKAVRFFDAMKVERRATESNENNKQASKKQTRGNNNDIISRALQQ